jgi:hypothetical protein
LGGGIGIAFGAMVRYNDTARTAPTNYFPRYSIPESLVEE